MQPIRTPPDTPDPLIDEVRAIRLSISEQYGHDLDRLVEHLREVETRYKDRMVRPASNQSNMQPPSRAAG
jgi:hypothetical protein